MKAANTGRAFSLRLEPDGSSGAHWRRIHGQAAWHSLSPEDRARIARRGSRIGITKPTIAARKAARRRRKKSR